MIRTETKIRKFHSQKTAVATWEGFGGRMTGQTLGGRYRIFQLLRGQRKTYFSY